MTAVSDPLVHRGAGAGAGAGDAAGVATAAEVRACAARARPAARALARLTALQKSEALRAMASALQAQAADVLAANDHDLAAGAAAGMSESLLDRLRLTPPRVTAVAEALAAVADLPDPVGQVVRGSVLPNGLRLTQIRVPIGVVAMIYEARPNVTVDATGIAVMSGNAVLLRGSASAHTSNVALVRILHEAGTAAGLPQDFVQLVPGTDRSSVTHLMTARGLVDVIIPRGGAGLIESVVNGATVPVIETGTGNCHVYLDASADAAKAVPIVVNSKARRPSVCNAAETVLVHRDRIGDLLPAVVDALHEAGVTVHADPTAVQLLPAHPLTVPATREDFDGEFLSLDIALTVVDSLETALAHIEAHSTGHTDAIVTENLSAATRFTAEVDSAAVVVNASTAFTDGGEYGFGAEIGISTQKLHARGPMGLAELTSTKYVVEGTGQIRDVVIDPTRRRKVGVMGGTFDPIHHGHLVAASEVADLFDLDEVVFVPTGRPWQKADDDVLSAEHRYLMAVIATAANPRFTVSRVDIDRAGATYTRDTLADLHAADPEAQLFFITGADALARIMSWKDVEEIVSLAHLVGVTRPGYVLEDGNLPEGAVTLVEVPAMTISSTACRDRVTAGKPVWYLVPDGVVQYINKHRLYLSPSVSDRPVSDRQVSDREHEPDPHPSTGHTPVPSTPVQGVQ